MNKNLLLGFSLIFTSALNAQELKIELTTSYKTKELRKYTNQQQTITSITDDQIFYVVVGNIINETGERGSIDSDNITLKSGDEISYLSGNLDPNTNEYFSRTKGVSYTKNKSRFTLVFVVSENAKPSEIIFDGLSVKPPKEVEDASGIAVQLKLELLESVLTEPMVSSSYFDYNNQEGSTYFEVKEDCEGKLLRAKVKFEELVTEAFKTRTYYNTYKWTLVLPNGLSIEASEISGNPEFLTASFKNNEAYLYFPIGLYELKDLKGSEIHFNHIKSLTL